MAVSPWLRAAGVSETTVRKGVSDLEAGESLLGRVRRPGGGRKRVADLDPGLRSALLSLVELDGRGDPMSPLRWMTKSTRDGGRADRQGHRGGADAVAGLLREEGFRLQANAKTLEGSQHAVRNAQFRYINEPALNLIRIDRRLTGPHIGGTRTSHVEALLLAARAPEPRLYQQSPEGRDSLQVQGMAVSPRTAEAPDGAVAQCCLRSSSQGMTGRLRVPLRTASERAWGSILAGSLAWTMDEFPLRRVRAGDPTP